MGFVEKVMAQGTNTARENYMDLRLNLPQGDYTWGYVIGVIVNWVLIIAGVVAFFYLVYSGFIYLTAGGNPDAAKKGQQGILNAIIGIVIITLSYVIVRAVVSLTA